MDPFTQRLMDRARARRENLEKKLSEQTAPRKRPMPLGDHNEIVTDTSSTCSQDDDSPKRQCVRTMEQQIKSDTPAIASVKSRRNMLSSGDMEVDDYVPPLRPRHDAMVESENTAPAPVAASRRNRFAALANNINSWEDDLSHPRPKQVEKPKKGWQPPKKSEPEPSASLRQQTNRSSKVIADGPPKPTRTFEHDSLQQVTHSEELSSSTGVQHSKQKTVVSSITVNLGSPKPSTIQIVPGTTTPVSPSVQGTTIDIVQGTTTAVSPSVKKIGSSSNINRSPRPFRKQGSDSPLTKSSAPTTTRSPIRSVAAPVTINVDKTKDEPTSRPVSSRMAAWQDKASPAKTDDNEPTKQPVATRKGLWEQKINEAEKEKKPVSPIKPGTRAAPKANKPQSTVVMREKSTRRSRDPTEETVHNRMSLWEKRVTDSKKETSPTKPPRPASVAFGGSASHRAAEMSGRRPSPVKSVVSSVKSPEKVRHATKSLADRLNEMSESGWQKNEIAEKIREQKEKEMAMLQNRWKNGLPSDEPQPETDTPEPPPPPPPLPPVAQQCTSPKKATPKSGKREVARQKIRTEEKEEQDINDPSHPKNFEGKLRAMGFDVQSGDETGKVAVADLTPIKHKEKQDQAKAAQSPKVSNIQLKVINVEDTRTTTTTFGDTKVSVKQTEGASTSSTSKPQGGKTSIYQLIKNKAVATPTRAAPTARLTYDDSFESESSFVEEDEEGYSQEEYTEETKVTESARHHTGASKMQAATSQNSVYSETSEYSEYTETEDYDDRTEEYTEDDDEDYSEEESEDGDAAGVDDLLDEVMDDTVNTETDTTETESDVPVPAPRQSVHKSYTSQQMEHRGGSGSSTSQQEDFRVPAVQAPRRRDNRVTFRHDVQGGATSSSSQYTASSTSSGGSSSASESEDERAYTIDLYRKSNSHRPHSTIPSISIVRQSEHSQRMSVREEPLPFIPEKSVRQQLRDLQDSVNQEQSVIQQTSNALNQCCGANSNFANSIEAVECHRLLLVSCKKREGYLAEMERLRSSQSSSPAGPRGSLTISDIRLPLKKDFVQKIGTLADTAQHFFLCLLRNGSNTIISQMVSTHDAMVRDTLDIPNLFKLSDIAQDFHFNLEIYSMSISREQNVQTPKKKAKSQTPKKGLFGTLKPSTPRSMQSPGGPNIVRTTNFAQIANLPISIRSINKTHFTLDRVPYASPLQGTIHVRLQCLMESAVEEKGFLTMFEDVGGFGAWHRRWCVLRNNVLSYWKYPDDENIKEAIGYIDLKSCITDKVGLIPRDICARPNTFEVVTVRRQHRGDSNTLVTRCANTMTTTRHQLSADTKEDRVVWCDSLNKALTTLRAWNSDAMRPIKVVKPEYADAITECIKSVNRKARP